MRGLQRRRFALKHRILAHNRKEAETSERRLHEGTHLSPDSRASHRAHFRGPRASYKQGGPANFCPKLALFAARLILLIGRAGALRLLRFWFFGLFGWFVFALGHCSLLIFVLIAKGMLS